MHPLHMSLDTIFNPRRGWTPWRASAQNIEGRIDDMATIHSCRAPWLVGQRCNQPPLDFRKIIACLGQDRPRICESRQSRSLNRCMSTEPGPRRLIIRIQIRERRNNEFAGLENMLDHGTPRLGRLSFFQCFENSFVLQHRALESETVHSYR